MKKLLAPILVAGLAGFAGAQRTLPSSITQTGSYQLGNLGGNVANYFALGGIAFDATGTNLYAVDIETGNINSMHVIRDVTGRITGFQPPVFVAGPTSSQYAEGGLTFSSNGTLFVTHYAEDINGNPVPAELYQYSTVTGASRTITGPEMANIGFVGTGGGCEFLPATASNGERLLVGDYSSGGLWEVPLTVQPDMTYSVGQRIPYMNTGPGLEGFQLIPTGNFGSGKGLLITSYDDNNLYLAALDPFNERPLLDTAGFPLLVEVIYMETWPMDVAFDPGTGDFFVSEYFNLAGAAYPLYDELTQFSGVINGGLDGTCNLYAPGCEHSNGPSGLPEVPTINTTAPVSAGQLFGIQLAQAPASAAGLLILGAIPGANLGGIPLVDDCLLHVFPEAIVNIGTDGMGDASLNFTLPANSAGGVVFMQFGIISLGTNALNFVTSDAGVCVIGV